MGRGRGRSIQRGKRHQSVEDVDREWSALLDAATRSQHTRPGRWQRDSVMRDRGTAPGAGPAGTLGAGRSLATVESRAEQAGEVGTGRMEASPAARASREPRLGSPGLTLTPAYSALVGPSHRP